MVVRDKSSGKIYLYDQAGIMLLQYISILDYSYLLLLRQKNVAVMRMRLQYLFLFIFFFFKKKKEKLAYVCAIINYRVFDTAIDHL